VLQEEQEGNCTDPMNCEGRCVSAESKQAVVSKKQETKNKKQQMGCTMQDGLHNARRGAQCKKGN
jgi:hypothetical protein